MPRAAFVADAARHYAIVDTDATPDADAAARCCLRASYTFCSLNMPMLFYYFAIRHARLLRYARLLLIDVATLITPFGCFAEALSRRLYVVSIMYARCAMPIHALYDGALMLPLR